MRSYTQEWSYTLKTLCNCKLCVCVINWSLMYQILTKYQYILIICTIITAGLCHLETYILVKNSGSREENSHLPHICQVLRALYMLYYLIFSPIITCIMLALIYGAITVYQVLQQTLPVSLFNLGKCEMCILVSFSQIRKQASLEGNLLSLW